MKQYRLWNVTGLLAAALVLGVLLTACSEDSPAPTQTKAPAATATSITTAGPIPTKPAAPQPTTTPTVTINLDGPIREIEVTVEDNTFPKITDFTAGERVRVIVTNKGSVEHTFEFTDFDIVWEVADGKTQAFEWTVPNEPGEYDCGCFLTDPDPTTHENMEGFCNILRPGA